MASPNALFAAAIDRPADRPHVQRAAALGMLPRGLAHAGPAWRRRLLLFISTMSNINRPREFRASPKPYGQD